MSSSQTEDRQNNKSKQKKDRFYALLCHHTNEVKELVIENARLNREKEELQEEVKRLNIELSEERDKNKKIKIKQYLGIAVAFVCFVVFGQFFI